MSDGSTGYPSYNELHEELNRTGVISKSFKDYILRKCIGMIQEAYDHGRDAERAMAKERAKTRRKVNRL